MAISNSYNFRKVSDRLTTSGVVGPNRLKGLAEEGYEVLINLLPDNNEHAVPDEKAIVEAQGVRYVYIPVDFNHPRSSDYEQFAAALDAAGGSKTHVHCAANFRVSGFYAAYAQSRGLWTAEEAAAFVEGIWQPDLFPGWPEVLQAAAQRPD